MNLGRPIQGYRVRERANREYEQGVAKVDKWRGRMALKSLFRVV